MELGRSSPDALPDPGTPQTEKLKETMPSVGNHDCRGMCGSRGPAARPQPAAEEPESKNCTQASWSCPPLRPQASVPLTGPFIP